MRSVFQNHALALLLAVVPAVCNSTDQQAAARQKFAEALLESQSELTKEIEKAIRSEVEKRAELESCEKHARIDSQCLKLKVAAARAVANLHGLKQQRAVLHRIIETGALPTSQ